MSALGELCVKPSGVCGDSELSFVLGEVASGVEGPVEVSEFSPDLCDDGKFEISVEAVPVLSRGCCVVSIELMETSWVWARLIRVGVCSLPLPLSLP